MDRPEWVPKKHTRRRFNLATTLQSWTVKMFCDKGSYSKPGFNLATTLQSWTDLG